MSPTPEFRAAVASARGRRSRRSRRFLGLLLLAVAAPALLAVWRVGAPPSLELETDVPGIGRRTVVEATAEETSRGLGTIDLWLQQGDLEVKLASVEHEPRKFWKFWGGRTTREQLSVEVVGRDIEGLTEGQATLRLVASRAPTWLRRPAAVEITRDLPVRLRPPRIAVESQPNYATQGGSAVVIYSVGESAVSHGVRVGETFFSGHRVPGRDPLQFALYAAPYDLEDEAARPIRLVAEDALRNRAEASFLTNYRTRPLVQSTIELNDRFLQKVVPEIVAETPELRVGDDLLAAYLQINGELRRENALQLRQLAAESEPRFLWREVFLQQPGAKVMDRYAARRTYRYGGREVDTQDHLGLDLASVRQAPVVAANAGKVVMASYFGIYGRTVVLDHGFGLMTLYAHLSSTAVEVGQSVERGEQIGRTGATGLAGGDHLHFTVLLGGEPVTPLEWFDEQWIRNRIKEPLGL